MKTYNFQSNKLVAVLTLESLR